MFHVRIARTAAPISRTWPIRPRLWRFSRILIAQAIDIARARCGAAAENGCSADQGYFPGGGSVNNAAPPCFCATRFARRTASGIAIGASSRTSASRRTRRAKACPSSGRDQRLAGIGLAPIDRGVGRAGRSTEDAGAISRGSLRRDCAGRLDRSPEAVRVAAAPAAAMGSLLAGAFAVGGAATRSVLGRAFAHEPKGHALGSGTVRAGRLSPAGAGQRVAVASGVVRTDRAGRSAGRRFRTGRDPQALSLSRSVAGAQRGVVRSSDEPLARPVQRPLRSAALRSDQHLFRGRTTLSRRRQAALRLFARIIGPTACRW